MQKSAALLIKPVHTQLLFLDLSVIVKRCPVLYCSSKIRNASTSHPSSENRLSHKNKLKAR